MTRYVLMVDLKDDSGAIESYRHHHRHVWPEVVESLKAAGIGQLDIHLLGRRLVMIVELEAGLDLDRVFAKHAASNPRVAEWERLMRSLQQSPPGAPDHQGWVMMEPVFRLDRETCPEVPQSADFGDSPRGQSPVIP
jgi:L-rhamnose mutarotase